jgi:hypothetical protein
VERISELHTEIEEVVDKYVDEIAGRALGVPKGIIRQTVVARAGECRFAEFRILAGKEITMPKFQPGHQIKGGRPKGARNKLAGRVFDDILAHWSEPAAVGGELCKGQEALETLYRERPGEYLRLTASVLPKEFVFENAVTELDDEELDRMIEMLRERALTARQEQALELKPEPKALSHGRH